MPNTPGENVRKFRQSQIQRQNRIGGSKMPQSNQRQLKQLRRQLGELKRRRASCKGDPDMLRDLDDQARAIQDEIRKLER